MVEKFIKIYFKLLIMTNQDDVMLVKETYINSRSIQQVPNLRLVGLVIGSSFARHETLEETVNKVNDRLRRQAAELGATHIFE